MHDKDFKNLNLHKTKKANPQHVEIKVKINEKKRTEIQRSK